MKRRSFLLWLVTVFLLTGVSLSASAGTPTELIKETTDKIISILTDPDLKGQPEKRRSLIRKAADEIFDWEEMSRRSLGHHWRKINEEERKTFVELFSQLLERTYMEKVEDYSGEKVSYLGGEKVEGDYATVEMKVLTSKNTEIPVVNKMKRTDGKWMVYDVAIEGVSLVNNYRTQFNSILSKSSFSELLDMLRKKISEK